MAHRGDVIENPVTGERITFLETSEDTGGELLRFEYVLPPGFSIPEHVHPKQEERHEIVSGTLRGRVGGQERDYREGQRVIGAANLPHAWRNPSAEEELRLVSELRPALHMQSLIETSYGVMRDWKANKTGTPRYLLQIAVLVDEAKNDFYFTGVPMPVRRTLLKFLTPFAFVGRRLGYGAGRPKHGGTEQS